jgi:uncharacterized membrane protein HdeD (DUF308 family)
VRKLFVSYARENKRDVDQLVEHLNMMSYTTWVDEALRGGQDWWQEILQRIADSDAFIATISQAALNSAACQREFDWAEALGKPVVPVAIEPPALALPSRVVRRQIIDYSRPAERALDALRLQGGLAALPPAPPLPEPMPEPPTPPWSYLTDLVDLAIRPDALAYEQQHQVLLQLESALRSTDPEERRGGRDVMERFSSRQDIYADVDRTIARLRTLADVPKPVTTPKPRRRSRPKESAAPPVDERPDQEKTDSERVLRHVWKSQLTSGLVGLIMGVLLVFATPVSLRATAGFVSVYSLIGAATQVILAYTLVGWTRKLFFISGAASLLFAALALIVPGNTSQPIDEPYFMGFLLAMGFLTRGLVFAVSAASARLFSGRYWYITMGTVGVIVSIVLLVSANSISDPLMGLVHIMLTCGWCLAIYGAIEIVSSFGIRKATVSGT